MEITRELEHRVIELLAAYTKRRPARVFLHLDPSVAGTVAVRAIWEVPIARKHAAGLCFDFLLQNMHQTRILAQAIKQDVFEVEFFTWPPQQRI